MPKTVQLELIPRVQQVDAFPEAVGLPDDLTRLADLLEEKKDAVNGELRRLQSPAWGKWTHDNADIMITHLRAEFATVQRPGMRRAIRHAEAYFQVRKEFLAAQEQELEKLKKPTSIGHLLLNENGD